MQDHPPVSWSAPVLVAGRYQVLRVLGTGARSSTFLARDLAMDTWRAIRVAHPDLPEDRYARILREARLELRLSHPHVLRIVETLPLGAAPAVVTELAAGGSLEAWMRRNGALPPARAIEVAIQCASALAHAAKRDVAHHDLVPGNVLVRADGTVAVTGFGLNAVDLELAPPDAAPEAPSHLAPELRTGGRPRGARVDVYALGALLHALCTGRRELDLRRAAERPELLAGLPAAVAALVGRCCGPAPEDRPGLDELHGLLVTALAACAAHDGEAPPLTEAVGALPGPTPPEEEAAIEALRLRLAAVYGDALEEADTESYTAHDEPLVDAAEPEVEDATVLIPRDPLRVEPSAWSRGPAPRALPPSTPAEVWAAPRPVRPPTARPPPRRPPWPAVPSVVLLSLGGVAALGLLSARVVERRQEVLDARAELVRVVVEERALVDHVPFAGTARRAIARIERDPDSALRPAREVAERVVGDREAVERARPQETPAVLRVEAALDRWRAAELACGWTCP